MNKSYTAILILTALILVLSVVTFIGVWMIGQEIIPTMQVNPPPPTTAYEPKPLNIEFYNENNFQNMSPFRKYPMVAEDETEDTEQEPTTETHNAVPEGTVPDPAFS